MVFRVLNIGKLSKNDFLLQFLDSLLLIFLQVFKMSMWCFLQSKFSFVMRQTNGQINFIF